MRGPLFKRHRVRIRFALTPGENLQDIETLYSIIVSAREDFHDEEMNERIALISLCFWAWPGKAPPYKRDIIPFRRRYRGVARSARAQEDFKARLTGALLNADSVEDLSFNELSEIFRIDDDGQDWFGGAGDKIKPGRGTVSKSR